MCVQDVSAKMEEQQLEREKQLKDNESLQQKLYEVRRCMFQYAVHS
jgi:hypothetical protein